MGFSMKKLDFPEKTPSIWVGASPEVLVGGLSTLW